MDLDYDDEEQIKKIVYHYAEGLQWVMHYYYDGVVSWGWFYPYHYAPRITDIVGLGELKFNFTLGKPFRPFEQLLAVLPAASKEHVPPAFQVSMHDYQVYGILILR
jgi:5'-3' exoribonuclease 1